jgi:hypothetical protein
MKLAQEPGFEHTKTEPRYFVLCYDESDPEYREGFRYEIQLLNDDGEAGGVIQLSDEETRISIPGYDIPLKVIEAAKSQEKGSGDYVNSGGECVRPF